MAVSSRWSFRITDRLPGLVPGSLLPFARACFASTATAREADQSRVLGPTRPGSPHPPPPAVASAPGSLCPALPLSAATGGLLAGDDAVDDHVLGGPAVALGQMLGDLVPLVHDAAPPVRSARRPQGTTGAIASSMRRAIVSIISANSVTAAGIGLGGSCRWCGSRTGGVLERVVEALGSPCVRPDRRLPEDLVVAEALPRPGGEVAGGGEVRHVDADLGEDVLRGAGLDPVD